MAESIVEIKELQKSFTGFQEIPRGDVNIAYVFFQSKDNSRFVITTEKKKIMAAELRIGKFDRIMTIRRGEFNVVLKKKIACTEEGRWFDIALNINYYIKDPEYIFKQKAYDIEYALKKSLSGLEFELGGAYDFRESFKLEKALWKEIDTILKKLAFLKIMCSIDIKLDETSQTILNREKKHAIAESDMDLSAIEKKMEAENSYELERMGLEQKKEISRLEDEIKNDKINKLGEWFQQFGTSAGLLISLSNGDITGEKMSQLLNQNRKELSDGNFNKLVELFERDMVSEDTVKGLMSQILLDGSDQNSMVRTGIETRLEPMEPETGKTVEEADTEKPKFQWNNTEDKDGTIE